MMNVEVGDAERRAAEYRPTEGGEQIIFFPP